LIDCLIINNATESELLVVGMHYGQLSASGPFQFPPPISGSASLYASLHHRRLRFSGSILKLISSGAFTLTYDYILLWTKQ